MAPWTGRCVLLIREGVTLTAAGVILGWLLGCPGAEFGGRWPEDANASSQQRQ
jgi:hypothetical protein